MIARCRRASAADRCATKSSTSTAARKIITVDAVHARDIGEVEAEALRLLVAGVRPGVGDDRAGDDDDRDEAEEEAPEVQRRGRATARRSTVPSGTPARW